MLHKRVKCLFILICLTAILSCANTSNQDDNQTISVAERAPIEGIWSGEFDIGGRGPFDFTAVHLSGHAFAYSQLAKAMCVGTVELDGENYISKYVLFSLDGGPFDVATITGKFKEDNKILSHFVTLNGGDTGALNLAYNPIYDAPSSLDLITGSWVYTDHDNLTTEINIENEGTLTGHDSDRCELLGYMDLVNPNYNAYKIKLEITKCGPVDGEYEGVAFLQNEQLSMQIANKKYALLYILDYK